jgi:squalene-hopene/tetraprenyl-beta-curcumene cyclase
VYGTAAVLVALRAAGEPTDEDGVRRAVCWLVRHQNPDGGWGEGCETYDDPTLQGTGPSTASQTAWAILGLLAGGAAKEPATVAGAEYLLRNQAADGSWDEQAFTGTGFPRAFYLRYNLYSIYFPLMALARYARATGVLRDDDR